MSEILNVTRRTVLKTVGAGAVSGAAFVGTTTGNAQRNFGYVDNDIVGEEKDLTLNDKLTLGERAGREKINCGPSNIKTEAFKISSPETVTKKRFYAIPSSWETGDTLEITNTKVVGCAGGEDSDLVEVGVALVGGD
jgi:hypothetical protein